LAGLTAIPGYIAIISMEYLPAEFRAGFILWSMPAAVIYFTKPQMDVSEAD
jgi:hypothetical protein